MDALVLRGQIVYAPFPKKLTVRPDAYLVAEGGRVADV